MNSIIRVMSVVNRVYPADVARNLEEIKSEIQRAKDSHADIVVFPDLALCGSSPGDFLYRPTLLRDCKSALIQLAKHTEQYPAYVIVGLPYSIGNMVVNAYGVIYGGKLVGIVADDIAPETSDPLILPPYSKFKCGGVSFCIYPTDILSLPLAAADVAELGCELVIIPSSEPVVAGKLSGIRRDVAALSSAANCAIAVCNIGPGETSVPYVYRGFCGIAECGTEFSFSTAMLDSVSAVSDVDSDIIKAQRQQNMLSSTNSATVFDVSPARYKKDLLRPVAKNPYYDDSVSKADYLSELFDLQVLSLATRMKNTGISKLVLGVSGGVDSTLALLTSAKALDLLGLPRQNLIAITLPGFGTSDMTYQNAVNLIKISGATFREISIKEAVLVHFSDIGHNPAITDVTYENAQARERTQILLDVANSEGAFVVGTGDLSESSLGWCTFGGDHLNNFNVNATVTKNMARDLIEYIANGNIVEGAKGTLYAILETPISPELLPTNESGEISQKTEVVLGPYEIHEFYLYYLIHLGLSAKKTLYYATVAFRDLYTPDYLKEKLILFINKFVRSQFKRTSGSESPILTSVHLNEFSMPSDLDPTFLLRELE